MIKARLSDGSIILGLSKLNIERLKEGKPISFDGRPLGFQGQLHIMYGETEESIVRELYLEEAKHDTGGPH